MFFIFSLSSPIQGVREALKHLLGGERTRIGFLTYDGAVTLYSLAGEAPKAYVVGDLDDESFAPLAPDVVLMNLKVLLLKLRSFLVFTFFHLAGAARDGGAAADSV